MERTQETPFIVGDTITERYFGVVTTGPVVQVLSGEEISVKTERNGKPFFTRCFIDKSHMVMPKGGWPIRYRDYEISLSLEPLAPRYEFVHKDFDGPEVDNRYGHSETITGALERIDEEIDG